MTPRSKIFLSYSHQDGQDACDHFEKSFPVSLLHWRDRSKLAAGDDWKVNAQDVIRKCDAVIALMTPKAVDSEAVQWEWKTALSYGKRLVPLVILPCPIPEFLPETLIRRDLTAEGYTYAPTLIANELQQRWSDVENLFTDLQDDLQQHSGEAVTFFSSYLKELRRNLDTQPAPAMPPEIFEIAFDILRNLMGAYPEVDEPLDNLADGNYRGPNGWPADIYAAQQGTYFKPAFVRLRSKRAGLRLRVVVVAMKRDEAGELESRAIFAGTEGALKSEFDELEGLVGDANWVNRYGVSAEQWRPFAALETVKDLVRGAAAGVVARGEVNDRIVPQYSDIRSLGVSVAELQELERNSVVIVDPISTRYPPLQKAFRESRLDFSRSLPIVRVGPNQAVFQRPPETRLLVQLQFDSEFEARRNRYDPHCDQVWDRTRLLIFLGNEIPRLLNSQQKVRTGIKAQINQFED